MIKKGFNIFLDSSIKWSELDPSNSENAILHFFYSHLNPFGLIIALDEQGSFFWGDGDTVGK